MSRFFFSLHQTWSYISSSCKGSSLVWGTQAINHAFLCRGLNMVHPGYTWCKFKFSFVNWTIFQGYIWSIWYLLTKTWHLLDWWTLALENLNPNSHLNWFAAIGVSVMSGIKMEAWSLCHCHFHWEAHYPSITEYDSTLDEHLYSI